jgi:hypothetical protein
MQLEPIQQTKKKAEQTMVTTPATPKDPSRDEVYTPAELFERLAIRFDLDVCAPAGGVPWIPADRHYSINDDGLAQPWEGRVWMNPPYSNSSKWITRFIEHGNGICFVPFARSRHMHALWEAADAICYPRDPVTNNLFRFMKGEKRYSIYMAVVLAAIGDKNVEALHRVGRVR